MQYIFWIIIVITCSVYCQEKSEVQKILQQSSTLKQLLLSTVPIEGNQLSIPDDGLDNQEIITRIFFSDDNTLIGAVRSKNMYVWGNNTYSTVFKGEHYIKDVRFSPDKQLIASTAGDDIAVWDYLHNTLSYLLKGHEMNVWKLCFSPTSRVLLSASKDGQVRVWNLDTRLCEHVLDGFMYPSKLSFSRLGLYMMCGTQSESRIWDNNGKEACIANQQIEWLTDQHSFGFYGENNDDQLMLREGDVPSPRASILRVIKCHDDITTVVLSNDGNTLVGSTAQGTLYLFDVKNFKKIFRDELSLDEIKTIQTMIQTEQKNYEQAVKRTIEQFFSNEKSEKI